jgi:hypothetical protein
VIVDKRMHALNKLAARKSATARPVLVACPTYAGNAYAWMLGPLP